uniref:Uncharacterized protein n=1 Tax=Arundo donax TaxID=35708 RepID=A0A0A8XYL1_ARUDO
MYKVWLLECHGGCWM